MAERLPSLTSAQVIRALQRGGFEIVREGRNHTALWRPGMVRTVAVPRHTGALRRDLLFKIIREAGLVQEEFRKLL